MYKHNGYSTLCNNAHISILEPEEEDELEVDLVRHLLVPPGEVVLVPGESVDEEVVPVRLPHGPLQQRAGDLHRHDRPVRDVALDQLAELGTLALALLPQEIA